MKLHDIQNATKGKFESKEDGVFVELELSKVYPNPLQPRKDFHNIEELAATIEEDGLLQPIVVSKDDDGHYMIIAGERRYRACTHLGQITIKAHIIKVTDKKIQELSFVENIQRDDLTDFEKAQFINSLWASGNYATKKELAEVIGKSQSYLSKVFKAINLCDEIIEDIELHKKDIGLEILQELSGIKDEEIQLEVYQQNPTREKIRNIIWLAKYNKKNNDPIVPQISPAKKEYYGHEFEVTNIYGISQALKVLHKFIKFPAIGKKYKITIEEI